jgi:tetratricopeptide (TPR) repeat protein
MNKRRRPFNYFKILSLVAAIGFVMYFGVVIGPQVQSSMGPTPTPTRDPESYVTEAGQLFEQGKLQQSIEAYQQAIRVKPNDPAVYIALARVQVWYKKYPEAQTSAENALLLNPNNSTARAVRGWALEFQKNFLEAEADIKRALELDDKNPLAHAYYAELLADQYLQGSGPLDVVDRMSEESEVALTLAPGLLEAHRARGYVNEAVGNNEAAIREYEQAATIHKNLADLQLSLGRIYRTMGIYDKAVEALNRANTLNPTDPTALYLISRVYTTAGQYQKAEQYAQQALKIDQSDANQHGNLALIYYRQRKWSEAATELSLVIDGGKDPDGVEVKPVELSPDSSLRVIEFYYTYGLALVKINRCGEALPVFQKLLGTVKDDETATYNANEGLRLCSIAAGTPQPTDTGSETPAGPDSNTPEVTPTP